MLKWITNAKRPGERIGPLHSCERTDEEYEIWFNEHIVGQPIANENPPYNSPMCTFKDLKEAGIVGLYKETGDES